MRFSSLESIERFRGLILIHQKHMFDYACVKEDINTSRNKRIEVEKSSKNLSARFGTADVDIIIGQEGLNPDELIACFIELSQDLFLGSGMVRPKS